MRAQSKADQRPMGRFRGCSATVEAGYLRRVGLRKNCIVAFSLSPNGKTRRCSLHQIYELSHYCRGITATRCEQQRSFQLSRALEPTICHTVHVHPPQGSRNDGNTKADGDQIKCRCETGRFLADLGVEACRATSRKRGSIQAESMPTSYDNEGFSGKSLYWKCRITATAAARQHMIIR